MSTLYTEIVDGINLPSAEGGAYKAIHTQLINIIENFRSNKITEAHYKLKLSNWFRMYQKTEHEYTEKIHDWFKKLKTEGSNIKT
jgi:hypothetical protein